MYICKYMHVCFPGLYLPIQLQAHIIFLIQKPFIRSNFFNYNDVLEKETLGEVMTKEGFPFVLYEQKYKLSFIQFTLFFSFTLHFHSLALAQTQRQTVKKVDILIGWYASIGWMLRQSRKANNAVLYLLELLSFFQREWERDYVPLFSFTER